MLIPSSFVRGRRTLLTHAWALFLLGFIGFSGLAFGQTARLLRDIWPGVQPGVGARNIEMVVKGDSIFAIASNRKDGFDLWLYEGQSGGKILKALSNVGIGYGSSNLLLFGGKVYFLRSVGLGLELWMSDGSTAGTQMVPTLSSTQNRGEMYIFNNQLMLFAMGGNVTDIWISDGTVSGTNMITSAFGWKGEDFLQIIGNEAFFTIDGELWKSDGTSSGTGTVTDLFPFYSDQAENLVVFNGKLWFSAIDSTHGRELWSSDGTASGTQMFDDYVPGSGDGVVANMVNGRRSKVADGHLFFLCTDGGVSHGSELRMTDGTVVGSQVFDFQPGPVDSDLSDWAASAGHVFFNEMNTRQFCSANSARVVALAPFDTTSMEYRNNAQSLGDTLVFITGLNKQVWVSDGTLAGTNELNPGGSFYCETMTKSGGTVYFHGNRHLTEGDQFWKTNGTLAGTILLPEFLRLPKSSTPTQEIAGGQGVFFLATDSLHGRELWHTDGTTAGTILLQDVEPGPDNVIVGDKIVVGDVLYWSLGNLANGLELWRSDGTPSGTYMLKEIVSGSGSSDPFDYFAIDSILYFFVRDVSQHIALWRSDGTANGTQMLEILSGDPSVVYFLGRLGNNYLFHVRDASGLVDIRIGNGQPGSSTVLATFPSGAVGRSYYFNGKAYFIATDANGKYQIWTTQGTPATTLQFTQNGNSPINFPTIWGELNGSLLFAMQTTGTGYELWGTDGTAVGTVLLKDIYVGTQGANPSLMAMDDSQAFFMAHDQLTGAELWVTDASPGGTRMVADLSPGADDTQFSSPMLRNHRLVGYCRTAATGYELFESDGTQQGTTIFDQVPGPLSSSIDIYMYTDQGLLFQTSDLDHGKNLALYDQGSFYQLPDPTGDAQGFWVDEAVPLGSGIFLDAWSPQAGSEPFFLDSLQGYATQQAAPIKPGINRLTAYPVPTTATTQLQAVGEGISIQGYTLYDLQGKCLHQTAGAPAVQVTVDLSAFPAGIYFARVDLGKAGIAIAKLVKQ